MTNFKTICAENLEGVIRGRSVEGDVLLFSRGQELDETFVDNDFDMEKIWAYLTIKDLLRNKTNNADDEVTMLLSEERHSSLNCRLNQMAFYTSST